MAEAAAYIDTSEALGRLSGLISDRELSERSGEDEFPTKRQLAVLLLYAAFCDGKLATWVRSTNCGLIPLVGLDWKDTVLWRDSIIGGILCTSAGKLGERLVPYADCTIILEISAFETWLDQRSQPKQLELQNDQPAHQQEFNSVPQTAIIRSNKDWYNWAAKEIRPTTICAIRSEKVKKLARKVMPEPTRTSRHVRPQPLAAPSTPVIYGQKETIKRRQNSL